ncbi:acyl-CoA dehydrogenase family protein [Bacillus sp. CHD6a]|uniref:acyl-CoA dehydrogenase family protein n=1 Tax=Bacillus sp. CHD6a TaxID=1643452 RepID=UPI0006CDACE1|nr:acyl-CoA dehydrogenase family protein [Bacillus sp. CHD6a]KPB06106.1 isovaleryl-CoA dehydrogenase [Bacillus sp. CHD6a]
MTMTGNFFTEDKHFQQVLKKHMEPTFYEWAEKELTEFGESCANEIEERAIHTDREGQPRLIKYNRMGNDVSEVWVNEGYKKTVQETYHRGIVGYVHKEIPELGQKGDYLYSYAQGYLLSQTEPGFYCPVTLTMATAYLLEHYADEHVKNKFLPHVISTGEVELFEGATFLTERQGGSDVGANETQAVPSSNKYLLTGEKYFASNAGQCGVAMVLARIPGAPKGTKGLSLFAVPWRREDGSGKLNGIEIRRLKDKLGVRAVPSAEVLFNGAEGYLVGEPSKGIHYMMEALNLSRVCNAIASLGIMQRAYTEARKYAKSRVTFGDQLINFPMIRESLVDMAVKQEVETSACFELVSLFDRVMRHAGAKVSEEEIALNRLLIALLKKETAEQAVHFSHEAIEMHGGNGFIEDFVTPRLLRDAKVLTVWEGTANILGMEVLRLMGRFKVERIFIESMKGRLEALPIDNIMKEPVEEALVKLQELCNFMSSCAPEIQTVYSKKIASLMVKIFESVVALDGANSGDARELAKAELFLQMTWKESDLWFDRESKKLQYFDLILNWEKSSVGAE